MGLPYPENGGTIVSAAQRFLTGSQSVTLIERLAANGSADAYHFLLYVDLSHVLDMNGLTNAVNGVKPVGVQWTLVSFAAPLLAQYTRLMSAVTKTLETATLADVT